MASHGRDMSLEVTLLKSQVNYKIVHWFCTGAWSLWTIAHNKCQIYEKKYMRDKWPTEVWLETNKSQQVKWCDAYEASESIMKAPEYFFLKDKKLTLNKDKPCTFWKQLPFMKKSGERNAWVVSCRSHQAGTLILVNGIFRLFLSHLSVKLINISV